MLAELYQVMANSIPTNPGPDYVLLTKTSSRHSFLCKLYSLIKTAELRYAFSLKEGVNRLFNLLWLAWSLANRYPSGLRV